DQILSTGLERLIRHPDHHGVQRSLGTRNVLRMSEHITTIDVDFTIDAQRYGCRWTRIFKITVIRDDSADACSLKRRKNDNLITCMNHTGQDLSCISAEIRCTNHALHREPEVDEIRITADVNVFEIVEKRDAAIPGHLRTLCDDVVSLERTDRH